MAECQGKRACIVWHAGWYVPGDGRRPPMWTIGGCTALCHNSPRTPPGLKGAYRIYGMYNVLFHVILFAYLLASLLFWLSMGLRQRWLFHLAHGLLGGGFSLQTLILGYNLYVRT